MSYQVLARKWRPRTFREMVGQQHVLQALINALDHNRLHHAYLFTGTRGVGKTTIARILAKCLNCETGVSSEPCGQCSSCREISEGRFVDLIEVDAASRTKVEDTRELLDNVQYAPSRGRYKVYLIDEVHMLSSHSFNALLKTLEEPPPHVKFLLATTDPQKLPVTILSRCLQFHLKNMNPERIVEHLKFVLGKEMVPFEEAALWQLGRAADGSMRDAMSLADQAIAFGGGKVADADVGAMLGTIDQRLVFNVLEALARAQGGLVLAAVDKLAEHAPDYAGALAEFLSVLHRIAIAQTLPEAVDNSRGDRDAILQLAQTMPAEDVQLYYQMGLLGRRDLSLAPDPRAGFEMTLLRMLAFKPQGVHQVPTQPLPPQELSHHNPSSQSPAMATPTAATQLSESPADLPQTQQPQTRESQTREPQPREHQSAPMAAVEPMAAAIESAAEAAPVAEGAVAAMISPAQDSGPAESERIVPPSVAPATHLQAQPEVQKVQPAAEDSPPWEGEDQFTGYDESYVEAYSANNEPEAPQWAESPPVKKSEPDRVSALLNPVLAPEPVAPPAALPVAQPAAVSSQPVVKLSIDSITPQHWIELYAQLGVGGVLQSTVANSLLTARDGRHFYFVLDRHHSTLFDASHQQRLAALLSDYFGEPVDVRIDLGDVDGETPAACAIRLRQARFEQARQSLHADPLVQGFIAQFGAVLDEETIRPKG